MYKSFIIDNVLPNCTHYPNAQSVIIIDNASIYSKTSERIQNACVQASVLLEFLPPYSLDYNPIEYSFSNLKKWIKRHYNDIKEFPQFGDFLKVAICKNGGLRQARAHFGHCGIIM